MTVPLWCSSEDMNLSGGGGKERKVLHLERMATSPNKILSVGREALTNLAKASGT